MPIISHTPAVFNEDKAMELAAQLTADDEDDWTYQAVPDSNGSGWATVHIYDEEGEFVGKL